MKNNDDIVLQAIKDLQPISRMGYIDMSSISTKTGLGINDIWESCTALSKNKKVKISSCADASLATVGLA